MKFSIIAAVAAFAGAVNAQSACLASAAAIPPCALGYLASAASSIGNCGLVDFGCQCSVSASVQGAIAGSVAAQCGGDVGAVLSSAGALCSCARANSGQTLTIGGQNGQCVASAQAIPPCALGYLASAASSIGNCALTDFACQCSNSASVQGALAATLAKQCSDVGAVLSSASALCACARSGGGSTGATTTGASSPVATGSSSGAPAPTGGSTGGTTLATTAFTGAAPTVGAVGGIFGAVLGLLAIL